MMIKAQLIIKKIILVPEKKLKKDKISYLKILLNNVVKECVENEETSDKIHPESSMNSDEIHFDVQRIHSSFEILFREDISNSTQQFDVEVQVMMDGDRRKLSHFGLSLENIDEKLRQKSVASSLKEIQAVEVQYILKVQDKEIVETKSEDILITDFTNNDLNPFFVNDNLKTPDFEPNSCILVVGTTGSGKTTTMNLYTG